MYLRRGSRHSETLVLAVYRIESTVVHDQLPSDEIQRIVTAELFREKDGDQRQRIPQKTVPQKRQKSIRDICSRRLSITAASYIPVLRRSTMIVRSKITI